MIPMGKAVISLSEREILELKAILMYSDGEENSRMEVEGTTHL
jgi:hypothetical protein